MSIKASLAHLLLIGGCLLLLALAACGGDDGPPTLTVSGIPDQDTDRLARRYGGFADYLSQQLGVPVRYVPSTDYAAVVTAFAKNDLQLAFFGALTGVQARIQSPDAQAIVQREEDAQFHSKLIVRADLPIYSLDDLKDQASDLTITFGSESSTSGHLMPRHFLIEAGFDPDDDFATVPNFSGSHDLTWKLVESGSFDVGALSEAVWGRAVREGLADPDKVREFYTTPAYFNYNWTVQGGLEQVYGTWLHRPHPLGVVSPEPGRAPGNPGPFQHPALYRYQQRQLPGHRTGRPRPGDCPVRGALGTKRLPGSSP